MIRTYSKTIPEWGKIYDWQDWLDNHEWKKRTAATGYGYWGKDGFMSEAGVFTSDRKDASYVVWFDK